MQFVTVHGSFNPVGADLVRFRLEATQFHSIITPGLSALSMDGYALAAGGILVQVPDTGAGDAIEFHKPDAAPPPA